MSTLGSSAVKTNEKEVKYLFYLNWNGPTSCLLIVGYRFPYERNKFSFEIQKEQYLTEVSLPMEGGNKSTVGSMSCVIAYTYCFAP